MWNVCSMSQGTSWCPGMALDTMWCVRQDATYQVLKHRYTDPCLVAVRTVAGTGAIETAGHGRVLLEAGTLYFCEMRDLRQYGTVGDIWQFYWWEFSRESGIDLPWYDLLTVPSEPEDAWLIAQIFARLNQPRAAGRAAASALFAALLHLWSTRWQRGNERSTAMRAHVSRAVTIMQSDLSQPVSLAHLAHVCGVSPRWLRQAFTRVLGVSPKEYQTNLRLDQAASALRMGVGNVTQVAEQVGYSSPFHFSRAFKARFGCSPSAYLHNPRHLGSADTE